MNSGVRPGTTLVVKSSLLRYALACSASGMEWGAVTAPRRMRSTPFSPKCPPRPREQRSEPPSRERNALPTPGGAWGSGAATREDEPLVDVLVGPPVPITAPIRAHGPVTPGKKGSTASGKTPARLIPKGYSGVVLKTWRVKVVGDGLLGSPPGASGGWARWGRPVQSSGAARAASGAVPAPRPRFVSVVRLAWWDGVSHVVTRPGSRARHSTREIVSRPARSSLNP